MIGILPCAGEAVRFNGFPKWMLPPPKGRMLLEAHLVQMQFVGSEKVLIGTNVNNFKDVKDALNPFGEPYIANPCSTMTETVLSAHRVMALYGLQNQSVLFGMPDTYFECNDVYLYLSNTLQRCDVAVAVCKARPGQYRQGGMVRFSRNQVLEVVDKPTESNFEYIWGAMAWKPTFWDCLSPDMPHVGYGLPVAIERGLNVRAVVIPGNFYDCGTPERYFECIRATTGEAERV